MLLTVNDNVTESDELLAFVAQYTSSKFNNVVCGICSKEACVFVISYHKNVRGFVANSYMLIIRDKEGVWVPVSNAFFIFADEIRFKVFVDSHHGGNNIPS